MSGAGASPLDGAELPEFLRFTPVPVRRRHDGWSAALQRRFIVHLARGASVEEAARRLGRSRQTAYALRGRAGAASFAAAWDSAVEFARAAHGGAWNAPSRSGIETILVPRTYRGRLVGYVMREDVSGAMAKLRALDRLAARFEAEGRIDELRAVSERAAEREPGRGSRQR